MEQDDELIFADEIPFADENPVPQTDVKTWKVLIVDDEPQVHTVTELVLRDLTFENQKIQFFNAYSAAEAKIILSQNDNICLALVDVVMEEEDAGLKLVEHIRDVLGNKAIRIILRTGQPGSAPEKDVIIKYDINDYKEKTEMSAQKLITCVITAFRNYEYIQEMYRLNAELEQKVADRVADLNESNRKLQETLSILQEDQEAGKKLQNKIFPSENKTIGAYHFSSSFFPSLTLSGDFLDYFEINEKYAGFYMADVSGHGISSAIVTVLLKNFIDNKLEKFILKYDNTLLDPLEICRRLNSTLIREKLGKYMTIFYGIIDMEANTMKYVNCGQFPYPFVYDGNSSLIDDKGTPIGLFKKPVFKLNEISLPEHFSILLASDGILEFLPDQAIDDKIRKIQNIQKESPDDLQKIIEKTDIKSSKNNLPDDVTFMLITR